MTIEQRDSQIETAKNSNLFLPLKAARIRQIQDEYDEQQLIEQTITGDEISVNQKEQLTI